MGTSPTSSPLAHTHIMSIADSAIPSSKLFDLIKEGLEGMSDKEKKDNIKKVNGIFEMNVKSGSNEATYTIDLKKEGKVYKGPAKPKADVTISPTARLTDRRRSCRASSRSAATSCSQPSSTRSSRARRRRPTSEASTHLPALAAL